MLNIKRIKELLKDQDISDDEAEKIRDNFYMLAEIIFEKWQEEKKKDKEKEKEKGTKQKPYPQSMPLSFLIQNVYN